MGHNTNSDEESHIVETSGRAGEQKKKVSRCKSEQKQKKQLPVFVFSHFSTFPPAHCLFFPHFLIVSALSVRMVRQNYSETV